MLILSYIPRNHFEQERTILGIFSTEDKLKSAFKDWNTDEDAILHNMDVEKDFDPDDTYVYEKMDIDAIVI